MTDATDPAWPPPPHLARSPRMFVRRGGELVEAPPEDLQVAAGYFAWPEKGPLVDGVRLTLLPDRRVCMTGEPIRVVHVVESLRPGHSLCVAGPKAVFGESVDGRPTTPPPPNADDPLAPPDPGSSTLASPVVDHNYEVTVHVFMAPGLHRIDWRLGALESNVLTVSVVAAA